MKTRADKNKATVVSRSPRVSRATRYQNAALKYYLGLTGSSYLHYGYWDPLPSSAEEVTAPQLRAAQEAYAACLLTFIPTGTDTVLDVGCGIGGNAAYLLARDLTVEGLAPDAFQQEIFSKHTGGNAPFYLTTFQEFQPPHLYDLVLFSESSQYIATDDIAKGAARLLSAGGYLLLADMLRTDEEYCEGIFSNCHLASDLNASLTQAGFTLVKTKDISTQIAPTLDLTDYIFRTFGLPTLQYVSDLIAITIPPLHALGHRLLGRRIERLINELADARTIFDQHLHYEIQLWQLPEDTNPNNQL